MAVGRVVAVRRRFFTENLGAAFLILAIGVLLAYVPAIVSVAENLFHHGTWYVSFAHSLDEFYLGALAVALSATLNYCESKFLDNVKLGRACGIAAGFTMFFTILCLVGFFLMHFPGKAILESEADGGGFVRSSIIFLILVTAAASLTVLQGRRSKDGQQERAA